MHFDPIDWLSFSRENGLFKAQLTKMRKRSVLGMKGRKK